MSDAYINIPTAIISFASLVFPILFSASSGFLAPFCFGSGRNRLAGNRGHSLPRNLRQDVSDRLRRLGRGDVDGHGEWRDLYHDALPKQNRKSLFTMFSLLVHERNEGSVKQSMFKCILDKVEIMSMFKGLVGIRRAV